MSWLSPGEDLRRHSGSGDTCPKRVIPKLPEPVGDSAPLDADLPVLIHSVNAHEFEASCGF
jgi:hypothetical protein